MMGFLGKLKDGGVFVVPPSSLPARPAAGCSARAVLLSFTGAFWGAAVAQPCMPLTTVRAGNGDTIASYCGNLDGGLMLLKK